MADDSFPSLSAAALHASRDEESDAADGADDGHSANERTSFVRAARSAATRFAHAGTNVLRQRHQTVPARHLRARLAFDEHFSGIQFGNATEERHIGHGKLVAFDASNEYLLRCLVFLPLSVLLLFKDVKLANHVALINAVWWLLSFIVPYVLTESAHRAHKLASMCGLAHVLVRTKQSPPCAVCMHQERQFDAQHAPLLSRHGAPLANVGVRPNGEWSRLPRIMPHLMILLPSLVMLHIWIGQYAHSYGTFDMAPKVLPVLDGTPLRPEQKTIVGQYVAVDITVGWLLSALAVLMVLFTFTSRHSVSDAVHLKLLAYLRSGDLMLNDSDDNDQEGQAGPASVLSPRRTANDGDGQRSPRTFPSDVSLPHGGRGRLGDGRTPEASADMVDLSSTISSIHDRAVSFLSTSLYHSRTYDIAVTIIILAYSCSPYLSNVYCREAVEVAPAAARWLTSACVVMLPLAFVLSAILRYISSLYLENYFFCRELGHISGLDLTARAHFQLWAQARQFFLRWRSPVNFHLGTNGFAMLLVVDVVLVLAVTLMIFTHGNKTLQLWSVQAMAAIVVLFSVYLFGMLGYAAGTWDEQMNHALILNRCIIELHLARARIQAVLDHDEPHQQQQSGSSGSDGSTASRSPVKSSSGSIFTCSHFPNRWCASLTRRGGG